MSPKNKKGNLPPAPPEKNNTTLIVVFSVVIMILLIAAALGWGLFVYQKSKTASKAPAISQGTWNRSGQASGPNTEPAATTNEPASGNVNQNFNQPPSAPAEGFLPPSASEKNMGYIKKVYTKNGKDFIDIDYIQWLTGAEAEKALREDGQCPKTGECIVYNDYYIRNQNPLIRTFEVVPDAQIRMQTLDSETTGRVDENKQITFGKLKDLFLAPEDARHLYKLKPFIVELGNNKIVKITEQYIP